MLIENIILRKRTFAWLAFIPSEHQFEVLHSAGYMLAGLNDIYFLILRDIAQLSSMDVVCQFAFPPAKNKSASFPNTCQHRNLSIFDLCRSDRWKMISHYSFNLHIVNIFHIFKSHLYFFFYQLSLFFIFLLGDECLGRDFLSNYWQYYYSIFRFNSNSRCR